MSDTSATESLRRTVSRNGDADELSLSGGAAADRLSIIATSGAAELSASQNRLEGEESRDRLSVSAEGGSTIYDNVYVDYNTVLGSSGDNILSVSSDSSGNAFARANRLFTAGDDDELAVSANGFVSSVAAYNSLATGDGDDTLTVESSAYFASTVGNVLIGADGDDDINVTANGIVTASASGNLLIGDSGKDTLTAQSVVDFDAEINSLVSGDDVSATAVTSSNQFFAGAGDDTLEALASGNNIQISDNVLDGNLGDDTIIVAGDSEDSATISNNILNGSEGDDRLELTFRSNADESDYLLTEAEANELGDAAAAPIQAVIGNSLRGGSGDDYLLASVDGNAQNVVFATNAMLGGTGDDEIVVEGALGSSAYFLANNVIDGGDGIDTLELRVPGQEIDFGDIGEGRISNIEHLKLASDTEIEIDVDDVLDMTDSGNMLFISGGQDVLVDIDFGDWDRDGSIDVFGMDFNLYVADDGTTLAIQQGIGVV